MEPLDGSGRFYLPMCPLSGTALEMHFITVPAAATFVALRFGFWTRISRVTRLFVVRYSLLVAAQ